MSRVWRDDDDYRSLRAKYCRTCGMHSAWCFIRYAIGRGSCCTTCHRHGAEVEHGVKW